MSVKDQVSAEEWKVLFNAPIAASTYVSSASGGGLEMIKEVMSASKFMQELAQKSEGSGYGVLVDDLLATMKGMSFDEAKENTLKYEAKEPAAIREEARQIVSDGIAVAARLAGGHDYKRWILDMAREVAETKTGGFLGIGSKSVIDEKEQAALEELAAMFGL